MKKRMLTRMGILSLLCLLPAVLFAQANEGDVWLMSQYDVIAGGEAFGTSVHLNSGDQQLAAYRVSVDFDDTMLTLDTSVGTGGCVAGPEGFISAIGYDLRRIVVSGFDVNGTGPGPSLNVFSIQWVSLDLGRTDLDLTAEVLADPATETIGIPQGYGLTLPVVDPAISYGDVNSDGVINIIDALLVAQYSVGIIQTLVAPVAGDVNADGAIDIIDALIIARYSVGAIPELPIIEGFTKENTELVAQYPGGIPPIETSPMQSAVDVMLRDFAGNPLADRELYIIDRGSAWFTNTTAVTDSAGIARFSAPVPWDGGIEFDTIVVVGFAGDAAYASASVDVVVNIYSSGMPTPPITPTPTPMPTPLP